ncbi:pentapeptide repeat-containing protein [Amycolatopsis sp. BJA-103]|uniref:pentapeptide repeat-containing protein n=1 Tax=unclassified Amycolatopsis TaxID=2618356 RepID=UPI000C77FAD5|nr:pentapeptide repeat-containing protein [Amycolatopsis sp. BJA-103]AUI60041.1 hypothetical protein BKN51_18755 [Amycolatopsis sp. BJA-103]PNE14460.1 hypothetical protein B1H26_35530 [Amycolatopsis sp. BJA-103]
MPLTSKHRSPHRIAGIRRPRSRRRPARGFSRLLGWDGWLKLGSLLTAVAAVAALWFTAQSLRTTQNQVALSEQGQLTDRFGKAVEQIGSDKLDVRLGGIYALERLARDSRRDHPTIMEVLTGFIRGHAPSTSCPEPTPDYQPPTDIQAAITVIGRRTVDHDIDVLNLARTCLAKADLEESALASAHLSGANLAEAALVRANLSGANLRGVRLDGATLHMAALVQARLPRASLDTTDLSHADLTDASLDQADLTNADFTNAKLVRTDFRGAILTEVRGLK